MNGVNVEASSGPVTRTQAHYEAIPDVVYTEAGEWLQQATLAIRARVPPPVLRDTIQPFPTFSEIYVAALKALRGQIRSAGQPAGQPRA